MTEKEKKRALIVAVILIILLLFWWTFGRTRRAPDNVVTKDAAALPATEIPGITVPNYTVTLPPLNYVPSNSGGINYSGSSYVASGCALCSYMGFNSVLPPSPPAQIAQETPQEIAPFIIAPQSLVFGGAPANASPYPNWVNAASTRLF